MITSVVALLGVVIPAGSRSQDQSQVGGPPPGLALAYHAAAWLSDGRLLLAGGVNEWGTSDHLWALHPAHDPVLTVLVTPRASPTATVLPDGRVVIAGGSGARGPLDTLEILAPATGVSAAPALRLPRPLTEHTTTLLPDGRLLVVGGYDGRGRSVATTTALDIAASHAVDLLDLTDARAGQTATLLTDGGVLLVGGQGPAGVLGSVELWDPVRLGSTPLTATLHTPRVGHTATLLPSGEVLIVGGLGSDGQPLGTIERFDPSTATFRVGSVHLATSRARHSATLLPTGAVLVWGGVDTSGTILGSGEVIDPRTETIRSVNQPLDGLPADQIAPALVATIPSNQATDVPVTIRAALRFSEPLQPSSITSSTVTLSGPRGLVPATVVAAEGGLLAFVTPTQPLEPGTLYSVRLDGLKDTAGWALPATVITFTTTTALGRGGLGAPGLSQTGSTSLGAEAGGAGGGSLGPSSPASPAQSLPPLMGPPGVTAVSGQALRLDGTPLTRVTLKIGDRSSVTDATGRFLLLPVTAGHQVMLIDGRTASVPGTAYGVFKAGLEVTARRTNVLPYTIWMPVIDTAHAVTIPSPTTSEVTITSPLLPGLEVRIPPNTVIRDHEGQVVTQVSLTQIPVNQPPFPLAPNVQVPLYFTIQPGAGSVQNPQGAGARIIYPNVTRKPPGAPFSFWNYEPDGVGWSVYGQGAVGADGRQVIPGPGVTIYEFTGAMVTPNLGAPPSGPCTGSRICASGGEPVDLSTGLFVLQKTDLVLQDVMPIVFQRTYRNEDTQVVRPFGLGATHDYEVFLQGDITIGSNSYIDLVIATGSKIHYAWVSGSTFQDFVFQHTATVSKYYGSKIHYDNGNWDLTFKDGTLWVFPDSNGATSVAQASLLGIRDRYTTPPAMTITLTRDPTTHFLTSISSVNGRRIDLLYDGAGRIVSAQDNIGRVVTYLYDGAGRLWRVIDPAGGVTEYGYEDTTHRMLTIRDPRGITFLTNQYDPATGHVIQQTLAATPPDPASVYQIAYQTDVTGTITQATVTDPRNYMRQVAFNASGYVSQDIQALNQPEQQTTTYTYIPQPDNPTPPGLVDSVTDALNRTTKYRYDNNGNLTSLTRLFNTPQAVETTFTYESTFNRPTSVSRTVDGNPITTSYAYNDTGHPDAQITITNPRLKQTVITTNGRGQPATITDQLSNRTAFQYTPAAGGDLTSITDPNNNTTTSAYDAVGRLTAQTDPRGKTTSFVYDALNRLAAIGDPAGGRTRFSYDPNGNLLSVTDALNHTTGYHYDNLDRLDQRTDPLTKVETYHYDPNGNLDQFTDRKNQRTTFTYDGLNRRTGATYADSSTTIGWDAGNRLTTVADSVGGTITNVYDPLDRLTSQQQGALATISYPLYDALDRRKQMQVPGQALTSYTYDADSFLTNIVQGAQPVTLTPDDASRRTSLTLPNGVSTTYQYDPASRLTALIYQNGAMTELGRLTYGYDKAGNRTQVGGSFARTLLPTTLGTATYDAANRQLTADSRMLAYDDNGNLTSITDGSAITQFTWDSRNRLAALSAPPATTASFVYDGRGRRLSRTVNGSTTQFIYDGFDIVREQVGSVPTDYLRSLRIDEALARNGGEFYLADALGSTLTLTDVAGAIATQYNYEPFGYTTSIGQATTNPFDFTGREDDGTGLKYYRARYYHPGLARFLSEDPLYSPLFAASTCGSGSVPSPARYLEIDPGLALLMTFRFYAAVDSMGVNPQLLHLYTYANNDPLGKTDPLGLIAGPQTPGCDWPATPLERQSPCAKPCCDEHDRCYQAASGWCDWNSFKEYFNKAKVHPDCDACNHAVVRCLWSTRGGGGGGRKDRCPQPRSPVVPSGP